MIAGDVRQFGRRVPYAEMVARIDAITKKEIQAVSVASLLCLLYLRVGRTVTHIRVLL